MNVALWIVQVLLGALFIFGGAMKLMMPIEELTQQTGLSASFMRFISIAELLGGLGLILPGALGIKPGLTPLAAAGLVIIMIGATVISIPLGIAAIMPALTGVLAAFVAYGRWQLVPHRARA